MTCLNEGASMSVSTERLDAEERLAWLAEAGRMLAAAARLTADAREVVAQLNVETKEVQAMPADVVGRIGPGAAERAEAARHAA
ncbi:MAG: hypothetical protein AAGK09_04905 [Planctomycetota bacterium]